MYTSSRLSSIRTWLAERIASSLTLVSADDILFDTPIDHFGLDSIEAVVLTGELGEWLGIELPPTLLYDVDDLEAVCLFAAQQAGEEQPEAVPLMQIAVAASFTAEPLEEMLFHVLESLGVPVKTVFSPYNQVFQSLLDTNSQLMTNTGGINILLVRIEDWFRFESAQVSISNANQTVNDFLKALESAALQNDLRFILALCPHTPDKLEMLNLAESISNLDEVLISGAQALPGVAVLDVRQIQTDFSLETVLDSSRDMIGHIPFTAEAFGALSLKLARSLFRFLRPPYKVVVLDCDNTLWRGVVGEDEASGVQPYDALQRRMVALQQCGRLLCLVSKNNEEDVWSVFAHHSNMPLQREHLAAWRINWQRKSDNIKELAAELGLGLDSFVFIDDNPSECAEVAAALPQLTIISLPQEPERMLDLLDQHWALDLATSTAEDRQRTAMMQQNRERELLAQSVSSFEQFLNTLCISVEFVPMQLDDVLRCTQLSERTNQFNTTTKRLSEADVTRLLTQPPSAFIVRVRDRFGDYGLVGFCVAVLDGDVFDVEALMMSCRVLGKRVEHTLVRRLADLALERNAKSIRFVFRPTERNCPVRLFLESLGSGLHEQADGSYVVEFAAAEAENLLIASTVEYPAADEVVQNQKSTGETAVFTRPHALQHLAERSRDIAGFLAEIRDRTGSRPALDTPFVTPRTPMQQQIAQIWKNILRLDSVGIYDSFFDLGGSSLDSAELLTSLYRLGLSESISLGTLGDPTVAGLAQAIEDIRQGRPPNMVATLSSLEDEAQLPDDILISNMTIVSQMPRCYFFTGASGYVGAYLLNKLLQTTDAHFICHVRASTEDQGLARIINNLQDYGLWQAQYAARVSVALGDLSAPQLGLNSETYERLANRADAIIHNAAWVNFIFPYQHLKPANVGGTEAVLRFALHGKLKPLHFISTLGVLMSGGYGRNRTIFEDEALDHSEDLPNGYEQTKWVADKLVRRAMDAGLPASIYRLGMLSGLSECGTYHKTSEFLPCFFKGCVQLGSFPKLDSKIEMVPVDFVARSVARIINMPKSLGKTYHLNHPNAVADADFVAWIRDYGYPIRHVPWDVWKSELMSSGSKLQENALYPFLDFIRGLQAHQTYIPEMGMTNFFAALGYDEVALCPDQFTLLQRYFDYFVDTDYLLPPKNRNG